MAAFGAIKVAALFNLCTHPLHVVGIHCIEPGTNCKCWHLNVLRSALRSQVISLPPVLNSLGPCIITYISLLTCANERLTASGQFGKRQNAGYNIRLIRVAGMLGLCTSLCFQKPAVNPPATCAFERGARHCIFHSRVCSPSCCK